MHIQYRSASRLRILYQRDNIINRTQVNRRFLTETFTYQCKILYTSVNNTKHDEIKIITIYEVFLYNEYVK